MNVQKSLKFKYAIASIQFLSAIILMTTIVYSSHNVYGLSPSLPLHETRDEPLDWLDVYNNYTRVITGLPYSDIFAVSYFSDGYTLNATLWLTEPFKFNTSAGVGKINYGMFNFDNPTLTNIRQHMFNSIKWLKQGNM